MSPVPWTRTINFASALLLHSCVTVLLKEAFNILEIVRRLFPLRSRLLRRKSYGGEQSKIRASVVLDAYTSIFSNDRDGELAELYFTNTGFILLAVSLASSVAMNLLLSDLALNTIVASTFGVSWLASLTNSGSGITLPVLALRRAGRFIWSDTPFVNFFSLIYIATVMHGQAALRLQDYITFRSIAVFELVFMKAKLAASSPEIQTELVKRLIASERVVKSAKSDDSALDHRFQMAERNAMIPFTTKQRLAVMLFKTSVGFHLGCLQGALGPASCPLPDVGCYKYEASKGWKIYRFAEDVMIIADCFAQSSPKNMWDRFIARAHGVLLRRLGKVRVIHLLRTNIIVNSNEKSLWHSNINLVTGVSNDWLDKNFQLSHSQDTCIIAGDGTYTAAVFAIQAQRMAGNPVSDILGCSPCYTAGRKNIALHNSQSSSLER